MDLFELQAKLNLDDSGFNKGINNAIGAGEKLRGSIGAGAVAIGNLAADMVRKGISAISGVINGAMDGYADYQQLIGGVETLFKTSASKVQAYARQSFKTTGLSANDYMETVTSFSASLLQGLNGDTEAAAELANTAVTDMADNANKLGTDISSIQNAYQGFAKGNFTMLDNLKLGYGGTQSEMIRLINDSKVLDHEIDSLDDVSFATMIKALHNVQTEMGITGTTAKEAKETISGSKASLQAAWTDLLTVVGGAGNDQQIEQSMKNFKSSFTTYMENFIPTLVQTISGSGSLVTAIADSIGSLPTDLLTQVAEGGLEAGTEMVGGVSKITNWLIDNISNMFKSASLDGSKVADFGEAIGTFLGETLANLATNAPQIIFGMMNVGISLAGGLINGLRQGLFGENTEVKKIGDELADSITDANINYTKSSALIAYMSDLEKKYGSMVIQEEAWKKAKEELEQVLPGAGKVFEQYGSDIEGAVNHLKDLNEEMRKAAIGSAYSEAARKQFVLLGEQQLALEESKIRGDMAQSYVDTIPGIVQEDLRTYAAEVLKQNAYGPNANYLTAEQAEYYRNLEAGTLNGLTLDQYGLDELVNELSVVSGTLDTLYGAETPESEKIWGKSESDNLYSLEQIDSIMTEYAKAQETVKQEAETQAALQKQINETQAQLDITLKAIQKAVDDGSISYTASAEEAAASVTEGGSTVQKALNALGQKLGLWNPYISFMPKATGIESVPFNGFRAELHRGEGVLTAAQNREYRNGGGMGTGAVVGAIQEMRQDLQNLRLVVGTRTFGRAVVDYGGGRVDGYIGQAESRLARGYGA